jgi:phosphatidylserine synthase
MVIVAALLVSYPWLLLSLLVVGYMASIPFSLRSQRRLVQATPAAATAAAPVHLVGDDDEQRDRGAG